MGDPIRAVRFPLLLLLCPAHRWVLFDVLHGSVVALPAVADWFFIGRDWVQGDSADPRCPRKGATCNAYYRLGSGELRFVAWTFPQDVENNIDSPELAPRTPCAPYQSRSVGNWNWWYDPPYILTGRKIGSDLFDGGLYLGSCGSPLLRRVGSAGPGDAQLSAGLVSWSGRHGNHLEVFVFDIALRRREQWIVPGTDSGFDLPLATIHTRDAVIAAKTLHQYCDKVCTPDRWALYIAQTRA